MSFHGTNGGLKIVCFDGSGLAKIFDAETGECLWPDGGRFQWPGIVELRTETETDRLTQTVLKTEVWIREVETWAALVWKDLHTAEGERRGGMFRCRAHIGSAASDLRLEVLDAEALEKIGGKLPPIRRACFVMRSEQPPPYLLLYVLTDDDLST